MKLPRISRRHLAIAGLTLAPLAFMVTAVLIIGLRHKAGAGRLEWLELSMLYMGLIQSFMVATHFRRPLVDPSSRWGILGKRERPRRRLWTMLVYIAAIAPILAFQAQGMREVKQRNLAWHDEQIAWATTNESENLARAGEAEREAEECRQKDARGELPLGGRSWAERARLNDSNAAFWKTQAAWAAGQRRQHEIWKGDVSARW